MAPHSLLLALAAQCLLLAVLPGPAQANVEKTIFHAPPAAQSYDHPALAADLGSLDILTPDNWTLRTLLPAAAPSRRGGAGGGEEWETTWVLLDGLAAGRRYELRICSIATQPTTFNLETHTLQAVRDTPALQASLNEYARSRSRKPPKPKPPIPTRQSAPPSRPPDDHHRSALLLRARAAADYFALDAGLMAAAPPVLVDLVLDPFLLDVLPRSLLPTVGYVAAVAAAAALVARLVVPLVQGVMVGGDDDGGEGDARRGEESKKEQ